MFKNYLKIAIRDLLRHKAYSVINIAGLAIGMACALLILLYVKDELGYDRRHQKADQIYRVVGDLNKRDAWLASAATAPPLASALINEFPQIHNAVRIASASIQPNTMPEDRNKILVRYQDRCFYEPRVGHADPSVFDIFTLPLLKGDPKTALAEPFTMVITETVAKKYFGEGDPIGRTLTIDNKADYKITGVMKDLPRQSHFHFDLLGSFVSLKEAYGGMWNCRTCTMAYTYLLLPKNLLPVEIEKQLRKFVEKYLGVQGSEKSMVLRLQPLLDIHLHSNLSDEIEPGGRLAYLYILATVDLLILLIACTNYMNLATARSAPRAKEVGVRKVIGADRAQLIGQFLSEATVLAGLALPLAMVLVECLLPTFNELTGKTLAFDFVSSKTTLLGLIIVALFVGLVSGSYPALFLSQFQPVKVLKGQHETGKRGRGLRRILVVAQFAFSITLIITTIIVSHQLDYLCNKALGFNKEQVVALPIRDAVVYKNYDSFKNSLLQNSAIVRVSLSSQIPSEILMDLEVWPGDERETGKRRMKILLVDYDFFETLGLELAEGRTFSKNFVTDAKEGFILNEAAVKEFGWESAVGRKFGAAWDDREGMVIGVAKDFHFESLHQKIAPMVFFMESWRNYIVIRLRPTHYAETLSFLKNEWQKIAPHRPFEYSFLDEKFDALHKSEEKLGRMFSYFTSLAIFIACLGLFGLAAFAAERRTKEIGIRKVLGASMASILGLLSKEFVKLVLMANLIAWPVAYIAMNTWLRNFAYRIDIGWWIFALAGGLALLIALLTISAQAVKAALANPVEALRYE